MAFPEGAQVKKFVSLPSAMPAPRLSWLTACETSALISDLMAGPPVMGCVQILKSDEESHVQTEILLPSGCQAADKTICFWVKSVRTWCGSAPSRPTT